jgi:hypothetical protein
MLLLQMHPVPREGAALMGCYQTIYAQPVPIGGFTENPIKTRTWRIGLPSLKMTICLQIETHMPYLALYFKNQ